MELSLPSRTVLSKLKALSDKALLDPDFDYRASGITREDLPALHQILEDDLSRGTFRFDPEAEPVPVLIVRALGQLRDASSIPVLIGFLHGSAGYEDEDEEEHCWEYEEIPAVLAGFGPAVVPYCMSEVETGLAWRDQAELLDLLTGVVRTVLEKHAEDPDREIVHLRELTIAKLQKRLCHYRLNAGSTNAVLIGHLLEFGVRDEQTRTLILNAFSERCVNTDALTFEDVAEEWGAPLPTPVEKSSRELNDAYRRLSMLDDHELDLLFMGMNVQGPLSGHKGFILGAVLSPNPDEMAMEILNSILSDLETGETIEPESMGQGVLFAVQLLSIHDSYSRYMSELFPIRHPLASVMKEPGLFVFRLADFLNCFLGGLFIQAGTPEESFLNNHAFVAKLSKFQEECFELGKPALPDAAAIRQKADEVFAYWDSNYVRFARDVGAIRQRLFEHAELLKADAVRSSTGRNDPCPCGSGKKFKKCCSG